MARRRSSGGTKSFGIRVEDLRELRAIPGLLDKAERQLLGRGADRLGDSIAEKAPGGSGGSIGRAVRTRTITSTTAEIVVDHPGAQAQEKGAYIVPGGQTRRGSAGLASRSGSLRFRNGTFSKHARIPPTRFATRGLRPRRKIILEEYARAFGNLRSPIV